MPIHPTAIVDAAAEIDPTAEVGAYAIIEGPVRIGARTHIYPHTYVTGWTEIGEDNEIHPHAVVGHAPQDRAFKNELSYCRIGHRNIIREGASIHRATGAEQETVIGNDCFLMACSHVGHNCRLGSWVTMANGSLLAGHVRVQDRANLSGHATAHQFVRIGELIMTSGCTQLIRDAPPFMMFVGRDECVGINLVGMRRAGFSREEIAEIKLAYRLLYRSSRPFRKAVDELESQTSTPPARRLVEFLRAPSRRGIIGPLSRRTKNESTETVELAERPD